MANHPHTARPATHRLHPPRRHRFSTSPTQRQIISNTNLARTAEILMRRNIYLVTKNVTQITPSRVKHLPGASIMEPWSIQMHEKVLGKESSVQPFVADQKPSSEQANAAATTTNNLALNAGCQRLKLPANRIIMDYLHAALRHDRGTIATSGIA